MLSDWNYVGYNIPLSIILNLIRLREGPLPAHSSGPVSWLDSPLRLYTKLSSVEYHKLLWLSMYCMSWTKWASMSGQEDFIFYLIPYVLSYIFPNYKFIHILLLLEFNRIHSGYYFVIFNSTVSLLHLSHQNSQSSNLSAESNATSLVTSS